MSRSARVVVTVMLAATIACTAALAGVGEFSAWTPATRVEAAPGTDPSFNGAALDGCPFISRDGKSFYMASNRAGGLGGLDIWVSTRAKVGDPWGAPSNVGAPVNSAANDFCPTIDRDGHRFYFVSNRAGGCGGADIYKTRLRNKSGFEAIENLGCEVTAQPTKRARSRCRSARPARCSTSRALGPAATRRRRRARSSAIVTST